MNDTNLQDAVYCGECNAYERNEKRLQKQIVSQAELIERLMDCYTYVQGVCSGFGGECNCGACRCVARVEALLKEQGDVG